MPTPKKFLVWTWYGQGSPKFVGWGPWETNHPAKRIWAQRTAVESPLHDWLRTFKSEPHRIDHAGVVRYYRDEAATVAAALRAKYKDEGHTLLDPRPYGTKEGGGASRQVIAPDLTVYGSVRQAAVDIGVNACTITRWCQTDGTDWDYLN